MKPCYRRAVPMLFGMGAILLICVAPANAATGQVENLEPESIAQRSLSVAEEMRTSGYCYSGVSKALSPLGVSLTGAAAYQAREQLLVDERFMPVSMGDIVDLRRGDIIVFNKSASHPYGHICVYQGNGHESSDHVSRLTTPEAYGGVTVFRLRSENNDIASSEGQSEWTYKMPLTAPDFRSTGSLSDNSSSGKRFGNGDAVMANAARNGRGSTKSGGSKSGATEFVRRQFRVFNGSAEGKSLTKKLIRFVMNNL